MLWNVIQKSALFYTDRVKLTSLQFWHHFPWLNSSRQASRKHTLQNVLFKMGINKKQLLGASEHYNILFIGKIISFDYIYILYLSLLNDSFFIDSDNRLSWVKLICFQGCHDHFSHFVGISCLFVGIFFEYTTLLSHTKANKLLRTLHDSNILTSKALHTRLCSQHRSCSAHWAFLSTLLLRQMLEKRKVCVPSGKAAVQSSALHSPWIWAGEGGISVCAMVMCWCTGLAKGKSGKVMRGSAAGRTIHLL